MMRPYALRLLTALIAAGSACGGRTADHAAELTREALVEAPPSAVSSEPPADVPTANILFTRRSPAVGDRLHEEFEVHTEMDMRVALKKTRSVADEKTARDSEILGVTAGVASKVKLNYTRSDRSRTADGVQAPNPGPVAGRSYLVERKSESAPLLLESDDGKPVSEAERSEIEKGMSVFGRPDNFSAVLASEPRHVGEKMDDVALVMKERMESENPVSGNAAERPTAKEVIVILRGLEQIDGQQAALLEVSSVMSGVRDGAEMTLRTQGKMWISLEGSELMRLSVEGNSDIAKGLMTATGKMTMKMVTKRPAPNVRKREPQDGPRGLER